MLTLLNLFWFVALGSLLVPLLIHFWNKRQPKRIKVGSLKWLSASVNTKARSLQFQDWPLLLLRCLLLTLLVLFLTEPAWKTKLKLSGKKYVWVAPGLLQPQNLPLFQNTIDSLLARQIELRYFNHSLKLIDNEEWDRIKKGQIIIEETPKILPYWQLAQRITKTFAETSEHLIFTSDQLKNFTGQRPVLPGYIKWIPVSIAKTKSWVQAAYRLNKDSVFIQMGNTTLTGTTFKEITLKLPLARQSALVPGYPTYYLQNDGEKLYVLDSGDQKKTYVNTEHLPVGIFIASNRTADGNYLKKVLQAVSAYTHRPIKIEFYTNPAVIKINKGMLFWLSDDSIPAALTAKLPTGLLILKDGSGKIVSNTLSWINIPGLPEKMQINRQVTVSTNAGKPLWQNAFGEPLLSFVSQGQGGIYYFKSRFNPQWNELPQSSFFPEIISRLLWPGTVADFDFRSLSHYQIRPVLGKNIIAPPVSASFIDLKYWFLLVAALLFVVERVWVGRKERVSS